MRAAVCREFGRPLVVEVAGYGEAYSVPFHPRVVASMIEDVCERCVVGADPYEGDRLHLEMAHEPV